MKLTLDRILEAGMATFADVGFEALSMRQVADRLGVHAGSLYYHVRNKDALLALMADRVAEQAFAAGTQALAELPPDADWQSRILAQATSLRRSINTHPGGAALLASSPRTLSGGALGLMERMLQTLMEAGVWRDDQLVVADLLLSYVTGFSLQEQTGSGSQLSGQVDPELIAQAYGALLARFPLTLGRGPNQDPEQLFRRSVQLICAAASPAERTRLRQP